MTGPELAAIRKDICGTNTAAFGRMLGLSGNEATRSQGVRQLETYDTIPEWFAIIARQLQKESSP